MSQLIDLKYNGWGLRELRHGDRGEERIIELVVPPDGRSSVIRRDGMTLMFSPEQAEGLLQFCALLLASKRELRGL